METKQELINAVISVKSGNQEAFNYIYQSTYKNAYYVALKYMKNDQDAQDVVQDSYIKIMNNISSLQDPKSFNSWLSMIVANTALNALKKKKPELFSDISSENDEGEAFEFQIEDEREINNPEVAYTKQETSEIVNMLLDDLSPEQKMAIIMFHFEGNSITNIASAMGCNENTVKSRLNQGRKKLKESCEDLQKKGYKLFGIAPLPLLVGLLRQEFIHTNISVAGAVAGATTSAATSTSTSATTGAVATTTKAGLSLGAKLAIAAASVVTAVGLIFILTRPKDKDETSETPTDVVAIADTETTTEDVTTEDSQDDKLAKIYGEYYEKLGDGVKIRPEDKGYVGEVDNDLYYKAVRLVDFNGDDIKELVVVDDVEKLLYVYAYNSGSNEVYTVLEENYAWPEIEYDEYDEYDEDGDYDEDNQPQGSNEGGYKILIEYNTDGTVALVVAKPFEGGKVVKYTYGGYIMKGVDMLPEEHSLDDYINYSYDDTGAILDYLVDDDGVEKNAYYDYLYYAQEEAKDKRAYNLILDEITTVGGIDTSEEWKKVYKRKLREIEWDYEIYYEAQSESDASPEGNQYADPYFEYALYDITGDGIPEFIGMLYDESGQFFATSFIMTCSKSGVFDYLELNSGHESLNIGNNEEIFNYCLNLQNKSIRTDWKYYVPDGNLNILEDKVYKVENGYFEFVGGYCPHWLNDDYNNDFVDRWCWSFSVDDKDNDSTIREITRSDYESRAEGFVGNTDIKDVLVYTTSLEEIEQMIDEY